MLPSLRIRARGRQKEDLACSTVTLPLFWLSKMKVKTLIWEQLLGPVSVKEDGGGDTAGGHMGPRAAFRPPPRTLHWLLLVAIARWCHPTSSLQVWSAGQLGFSTERTEGLKQRLISQQAASLSQLALCAWGHPCFLATWGSTSSPTINKHYWRYRRVRDPGTGPLTLSSCSQGQQVLT